jgi:copper transport protein
MPVTALGHASVISTDPGPGTVDSPPGTISIHFTEPVRPVGRGIRVFAPDGREVERGTASARGATLAVDVDAAEKGTYRVEWKVIAADTHPSRGTYVFSVGTPGPAPRGTGSSSGDVGAVTPAGLMLLALGRWLHLVGFALGFGGIAFQLIGLRRRGAPDQAAMDAGIRPLAYLGAAAMVVAEPVALVGQAVSLGGIDGPALADVLASSFGRVAALRVGGGLVLWMLLGAVQVARGRGRWAILALGAAVALVDAAASHPVRGAPAAAGLVLNAVHEAAMGVWVGGLIALVLLSALPALRPSRPWLVGTFGRLALTALAVLVATGAVLALVHISRPAELVLTAYGVVLVLKATAVGVAVTAAIVGLRSGRSWRAEALALFSIVALAALLVSLPPPR